MDDFTTREIENNRRYRLHNKIGEDGESVEIDDFQSFTDKKGKCEYCKKENEYLDDDTGFCQECHNRKRS